MHYHNTMHAGESIVLNVDCISRRGITSFEWYIFLISNGENHQIRLESTQFEHIQSTFKAIDSPGWYIYIYIITDYNMVVRAIHGFILTRGQGDIARGTLIIPKVMSHNQILHLDIVPLALNFQYPAFLSKGHKFIELYIM